MIGCNRDANVFLLVSALILYNGNVEAQNVICPVGWDRLSEEIIVATAGALSLDISGAPDNYVCENNGAPIIVPDEEAAQVQETQTKVFTSICSSIGGTSFDRTFLTAATSPGDPPNSTALTGQFYCESPLASPSNISCPSGWDQLSEEDIVSTANALGLDISGLPENYVCSNLAPAETASSLQEAVQIQDGISLALTSICTSLSGMTFDRLFLAEGGVSDPPGSVFIAGQMYCEAPIETDSELCFPVSGSVICL